MKLTLANNEQQYLVLYIKIFSQKSVVLVALSENQKEKFTTNFNKIPC